MLDVCLECLKSRMLQPAHRERTVMLLQPSYLPWLGFFEQALRSDFFVVFDDAQYTKGDWRNRNRIKTRDGRTIFLTVPVQRAATETPIREIRIAEDSRWIRRHLNQCREQYGKAPFFEKYFPEFARILNKKHGHLLELNLDLIQYFLVELGGHCEILLNSSLSIQERGKERMLGVAKHLGASVCYNGAAGRALYDPGEFRKWGVALLFQEFHCPRYEQGEGEFVPNLSILDLLFRCGPQSRALILEGGAKNAH